MEKTLPTSGTVRLFVQNNVGLIVVTARACAREGEPQDEGVHVSLEPDTPGAAEVIENAIVESRSHRGRDHVVVKIPRLHGMKFIRRNSVTVRVEVPSGSDVSTASASGHVELNGVLGVVDVKTASGDITADDVEELQAKTASGDVEVGTVGGELRMQTASGDLRCSRVGGRTSIRTASGDVEIGAVADRVDLKGSSGDVRLGDVAGDLSIAVVSGDVHVLSVARGRAQVRSISGAVEVGIARGVALQVDAEAASGTVHSDIPLHDAPAAAGPEEGANVVLNVRTVSGNIVVTRADEAFAR